MVGTATRFGHLGYTVDRDTGDVLWGDSTCGAFGLEPLGRLGIQPRGAVFANIQNQHGAPGICTASGRELLTLAEATGEERYLRPVEDIAGCIPQMVVRPGQEQFWGDLPTGSISERLMTMDGLEPCGHTAHLSTWSEKDFLGPQLRCEDGFLRGHEFELRRRLFHATLKDDTVFEPWLTLPAVKDTNGGRPWSVQVRQSSDAETNARHMEYPLRTYDEFQRVRPASHVIDEGKTREAVGRLRDAIDLDRGPWCKGGFSADLSTDLRYLRRIENFMIDMYENPEALHRLLAAIARRFKRWRRPAAP
jgi:hypothetical protein